MWYSIGSFILKNKITLALLLVIATSFMAYKATKVQMSYDFSRAVPLNNIKYQEYQAFKEKFGNDGALMILGIQSNSLYTVQHFNAFVKMQEAIKKVPGVQSTFSLSDAVVLAFNDSIGTIKTKKIFAPNYNSQSLLDSGKIAFENLPFYYGLLHQPSKNAYSVAITLNKDSANSKARTRLVKNILTPITAFQKSENMVVHISGLPYIRTEVANKITKEMNWFLIGSLLLSALTLLLFFRSIVAMCMSLLVVAIGVIFSIGTMVLLGYKITLLTALIPPLIVVIGVPNCIYFLNKYHTSFLETNDKQSALVNMIGKMGIVTLFCNIAAAIGFAVFALTSSELLKEFGIVAGINIMLLFFISLIFIPIVLSYTAVPKPREMQYLNSKWMLHLLQIIEHWAMQKATIIYTTTAVITLLAIVGIFRLKSEGFIVDDLPKQDKIYTDLKWFEENFDGVMPLEIVVDTKKKNGLTKSLKTIEKIDEFSAYIAAKTETAKPLSFVDGLKFARQGYYDNDSTNYTTPTEFDIPLFGKFLKAPKDSTTANNNPKNGFASMLNNFMDSSKSAARISVNMKDIGSKQLPILLDDFQKKADEIFDTAAYKVTFTGTSVSFLEGSKYIINGLKESIAYAFLLIAFCMLYLFKSFRILLCSLIPNIIPLIITAGIMGWVGIALKPSTVLVFSVALGIAIDVTIRFLVNYKQELSLHNNNVATTLVLTIRHTGISIIYTSLVLIAGFIIFCISDFDGTRSLGWLTSLTLVIGTLTNLLLLPSLLLLMAKKK